MKPKLTLLTALAFASVSGVAIAQDVPPPPTRPTRAVPEKLLPYDVNTDGRLSREEYKAYLDDHRPENPKSEWDANDDGKLDADEIEAARAAMREKLQAKFLARFKEADADTSESLDLEEFTATLPDDVSPARAAAAFDRLDADDNDLISEAEFLKFSGLPTRPDAVHKPKPRPAVPKPKPPQPPVLPEALKKFDLDGNGILSRREIESAIKAGTWPVRPRPPADDDGEPEDHPNDPGLPPPPVDGP